MHISQIIIHLVTFLLKLMQLQEEEKQSHQSVHISHEGNLEEEGIFECGFP